MLARPFIEAAMMRLPRELHYLLIWLCTGRAPGNEV
jgi:hypothetical protein